MPKVRVGISGWNFEGWRGTFYPKTLSQKKELYFASRQFSTIEVNGSFYSLQTPSTYRRWYETAPKDFIFSLKGPRFITHIKRLNDVSVPLANFFASGVFELKEKLGPILWQLPPRFLFKSDLIENFLKNLPKDLKAASQMAKRSDDYLKQPPSTHIDKNRKLRYAIEVRHPSFLDPVFFKLLRKYRISLVITEGRQEWPKVQKVTADFLYARLHGDKEVYASGYSSKALDQWSGLLKKLSGKTHDVFVYFDNDVKIRSPYDATGLSSRLTTYKPATKLKLPQLKSLHKIYGPRITRPKSSN